MRKWIIIGIIGVLVIVGGVAAFASGGDSGSKPVLITTEVKRRDLQDKVTVTGTLGRVEQRTVNAATNSTVSNVYVKDGATLQADQPVLALDGRSSVTENGDVSFFRKLDVGASGADVLQLEQILQASGFSPGTVDQQYTEQTRAALGQWQGAHGYPGSAPQTEQSITVGLQPGTGYKVGKQSSAAVVIGPRTPKAKATVFHVPRRVRSVACPGSPSITISGGTTITEGATTTITVSSDIAPASPIDVGLTSSGSATSGSDYVTFPPTVTLTNSTPSASFTFTSLTDFIAEPPEFAIISVAASPSASYCVGSPNSTTVTINDAGGTTPVVTLVGNTARVSEGQPAQFAIGLDRGLSNPLQVQLSFGGDAVNGVNYSRPAGLIIVPAGQTSLPVTVPTLDNGLVEPDHTLVVSIASSSAYTIGSPSNANVTILSEDVPEIQIVGGTANIGKGGAANFRVIADQAPLTDTTIQYQAAGTAKPGVDLAPLTGTVLLRAGTTSASIRVFALNTDVAFIPTDMIVAHWPTRVGSTLVKVGDIVPPGAPLFSITETGFTVTLKASAADRTKLKVGQQVTVQLQGATTSAPGVITQLDEAATVDKDTKQQAYQGKVQVQGDFGAADGAPVTINVIIEQRTGVLTVPIAAVKQNGAGQDVVRVLDLQNRGRIDERPVKTGLSEGSYIEIKSGLKGNEVVVVEVDQGSG